MQIKVYKNVYEMTGIGEEWFTDAHGEVIAVFIDGNFRCSVSYIGDNEVTKVAV